MPKLHQQVGSGPWHLHKHIGMWSIWSSQEEFVAIVPLAGEANARLIAAAPNLLAACETGLEEVCPYLCPSIKRTGEGWTHSETCVAMHAAIAAAYNAAAVPDCKACLTIQKTVLE